MNVLVFYDQYETHTNTVYEHLRAFSSYSVYQHFFCHLGCSGKDIDWDAFDAVVIHYSARVVVDSFNPQLKRRIASFSGWKVLFAQDEYDLTEVLRKNILQLGIELMFTCVPEASIESIYPVRRFPNTRFVPTLTGYVPSNSSLPEQWVDMAERPIHVGYRARALPFWYGDLGQEKQSIAEMFRLKSNSRGLVCDIEWHDQHRVYGDAWPRFISNCRAMLGTESGSNLFDDDGTLRKRFIDYQLVNPNASYNEARNAVLGDFEEKPIMNQVSPRVFEAIAAGTVLILFEGRYSGLLQPKDHYIPLKKDFSNIEEVFETLADTEALRGIAKRAFDHVIASGHLSYEAFIARYDVEIGSASCRFKTVSRLPRLSGGVTTSVAQMDYLSLPPVLRSIWRTLPLGLRVSIKALARNLVTVLRGR